MSVARTARVLPAKIFTSGAVALECPVLLEPAELGKFWGEML
jgi:hypothetical protein